MKGINSTGAPLVDVPGWMGGWVGGWMGGCKSRFKDCLQQSKKVKHAFMLTFNSVFITCLTCASQCKK
jgi:hypothetical protein